MLLAADIAQQFGKSEITVCEFGVANGKGLLSMIAIAEQIQRETNVKYRIFGFDTGEGHPEPQSYKDHPEALRLGQYPMGDRKDLEERLAGRAELVIGDIKDTVDDLLNRLSPSAPLGFASFDVDFYSSTKHALRCISGSADLYSPFISMFFDRVNLLGANNWCGQLAAINELNAENERRKIDIDRTLLTVPKHRQIRRWYANMYMCHILDHEARQCKTDRPV